MFGYITEMDTKVGEIMTQLATVPAQLNNTVIIFSRCFQPASPHRLTLASPHFTHTHTHTHTHARTHARVYTQHNSVQHSTAHARKPTHSLARTHSLTPTRSFNSLVGYLCSDNGAPPASDDVNHQVGSHPGWIARNHPFRGYKTLIWEGGTRVGQSPLPSPSTHISIHTCTPPRSGATLGGLQETIRLEATRL